VCPATWQAVGSVLDEVSGDLVGVAVGRPRGRGRQATYGLWATLDSGLF
jgi:hypothetical protein